MIYGIEDRTLTALGDAVRNKAIGENVVLNYHTTFYNVSNTTTLYPAFQEVYKSPQWKLTINNVEIIQEYNNPSLKWAEGGSYTHYDLLAPGALPLTIITPSAGYFYPSNIECNIDFSIECVDENGEPYKYTPAEMINEINNLSVVPSTAFNITDDCQYRFVNGWEWFIEEYGDKITTKDITDASYMFKSSKVNNILFEINMKNGYTHNMYYMFYGAVDLKQFPKINNARPSSMSYLFSQCFHIQEIPEDYFDTWDFSYMQSQSFASIGNIFAGMYSLRRISPNLLKPLWTLGTSGSNVPYTAMFQDCYSLDEVNDIIIQPSNLTTDRFGSTFIRCYRVKDITFETNEDNSVKTANWKSQVIDLATYTGYVQYEYHILDNALGFTPDKRVSNDETYQALKNDPDWYSLLPAYSRYNHDSAVNTINSLPDTSAYGTNTIKFKGEAGSATDGGAINTLTEEEIAVATAKGWTVSLV